MGLEMVSRDLDTVLKDAEIVSLHVPLVTDPGPRNTAGVLNESRMRLLKRGAVLLNFARPQLIDSDVLLRVMLDGQVSKAVIDGCAIVAHIIPRQIDYILCIFCVVYRFLVLHNYTYTEFLQ